jgi:hypothetical protein
MKLSNPIRLAAILLMMLTAIGTSIAAGIHEMPAHQRTNVAPAYSQIVAAALRQRLQHQYLFYRWVVCVETNRSFAGRHIARCNVDFGDPHIVSYCAVLIKHTLLTDYEDRTLSCVRR